MSIFPGPTPPFTNPPIEPQYYQPSRFVISNITLGLTTLVTTTLATNYVVGQLVRLLIPSTYGCGGLNEILSYVIAIPDSTNLVLDYDSQGIDPFITNPSYGPTPPQIIAVGDINTGAINSSGRSSTATAIPGSFINISPN